MLDGNLALHCYHVTALLGYLIQGNNASLFFIFLYFFPYNPRATYFQGLHTFFCFFSFLFLLYIIVTFSVSVLKKHFALRILFILLSKRKSTTSAHVVLFLFGMSLRGFPRCIAVCYYIQSWGMLLRRGSIYINWSLPSQDRSWGKQPATA